MTFKINADYNKIPEWYHFLATISKSCRMQNKNAADEVFLLMSDYGVEYNHSDDSLEFDTYENYIAFKLIWSNADNYHQMIIGPIEYLDQHYDFIKDLGFEF